MYIERLELSIKSKMNLFIGDNASGEITIENALCSSLNTFFIVNRDDLTRFCGISKGDFKMNQN